MPSTLFTPSLRRNSIVKGIAAVAGRTNHTFPTPLDKQATTIVRLLSGRRWFQLEALLTSEPGSTAPVDDPSPLDTIIHSAARFQAPPRIISLLARSYPRSLANADAAGRYPVHVAARWGASPVVVAYLIRSNPSVAGVPDSAGKTPMHYVGEFYLASFEGSLRCRDESMLRVVRLLKDAAPRSVNLEDDDGMNAIEYALLSGAHLKVVKAMQRACRDDWRERSYASCVVDDVEGRNNDSAHKPHQLGRRRHRDLVKDIETMSSKLQREYGSGRMEIKGSDGIDRIHVHQPRATANTQAAKTA